MLTVSMSDGNYKNPFVYIFGSIIWIASAFLVYNSMTLSITESVLIITAIVGLGIIHGILYQIIEDTIVNSAYNKYYTT